jgi:hypothetical protein
MTRRGPVHDHNHPELWEKADHYRFEARMQTELKEIEAAVSKLTTRITLMLGGLTLIAVLLPVIAPFIRLWLSIPQNPLP